MGSSARSAGEALGRREGERTFGQTAERHGPPDEKRYRGGAVARNPAPMPDSPGQAEAVAQTLRIPSQIGIQVVGALYANFC